ncbi:MAG: Cys-tRNA(Pro) deacylase [Spirochaetae bacterium HGW-Spirochaetae-9]|nr:MAG: Cys-tRNA(Pro) deacylase [Spirochaetae bacterium HGW-Spirochaetae-9]
MAQQNEKIGEKTNAIRLLEAEGLSFEIRHYEVDEDLSATHAAEKLKLDPDQVFKTIVLQGERTGYFVCVIPGSFEIDLKKAARAAGDKGCVLLPLKKLEPLTGYVRGGCSPIGMKKRLPTYLDETALLFERISVSAGRRGMQVLLNPGFLLEIAGAKIADLIV